MITLIKIRNTGVLADLHGFTKRRFNNEVLKPCNEAMGLYWHKKIRRKHFTEEGAREYGYTKRKGERHPRFSGKWRSSYAGKKFKKVGHNLPLVYTGATRNSAHMARIAPTSKLARIYYNLPVLNYRQPTSQVRMREEFSMISEQDNAALARVHEQHFQYRLAVIQTASTKTIAA